MENKTESKFLTSRAACDVLGFSRPDAFVKNWRAAGLPLYRRPGGHYLVAQKDLERFVQVVIEPDPASP